MTILLNISIIILLGLLYLRFWHYYEARKIAHNWQRLVSNAEDEPALFSPEMVTNLPSAARRFFIFAIQPGTPLRKIAQIWMNGHLSLGTLDSPIISP